MDNPVKYPLPMQRVSQRIYIDRLVASKFNIEPQDLYLSRKIYARPRFVAWWLLKNKCGWSMRQIYTTYSKDRTSVLYGIGWVDKAGMADILEKWLSDAIV